MANEINNQRFYMFLSSFEGKGGWVSAADQDGDNYIMQCEFYDFIKDNWDGENTPSDDLINKFWNSLDTNTSESKIKGTNLRNLNALDKNEMKDLEKHLATYVAFDLFFGQGGPVELEKSNLRTSGILTNSNYLNQWKGSVKDALSVFFAQLVAKNPNITEDEIKEELTAKFEEVKDAITAEYIGVEYISKLQSTVLKGYDYDLASDEYLTSILNKFCNQYLNEMLQGTENYTLQGLKNGIVNLINQYLEKSGIKVSGSNNGNDVNIDNYGFNDNIITSLQKQVIFNTILKEEADLFKFFKEQSNGKHDYLADAKKYLMQLIEDRISEGSSFEQLKSVRFKDSEYCDELNNLIDFDKTYDDIYSQKEAPTQRRFVTNTKIDLYTRLANEFGKDFADLVAETDQYLEVYKNIIADAREKYMNDEFASGQKLQDYIFEQIKLSLADFYAEKMNGISDFKELNKIYDNLIKSAEAQKSSTDRTNAYRNAAIMYCGALANINSEYKDIIKEVFGENYAQKIENLTIDDIKKGISVIKKGISVIENEKEYNMKRSEEAENDLKGVEKIILYDVPEIIKDSDSETVYYKLHLEFGVEMETGKIAFQEANTTKVFNKILRELDTVFSGTSLDSNKLLQAAWITTYNDFNSSEKHNATYFVIAVLENLKLILQRIKDKPQVYGIFEKHTAYANNDFIKGLPHYGTNTTDGEDEKISYKEGYVVSTDSVVSLNNSDNTDYQLTMSNLLTRLIKAYSNTNYDELNENVIRSIFVEAQKKAIDIAKENIYDCPHGTGKGSENCVDDLKNSNDKTNWDGADNRKDDGSMINMDELVQLTLYCFDKLLYKYLINGSI